MGDDLSFPTPALNEELMPGAVAVTLWPCSYKHKKDQYAENDEGEKMNLGLQWPAK